MFRSLTAVGSLVLMLFGAVSAASAQPQIDGTVASTKLTACDMKLGTCEVAKSIEVKDAKR